MGTNLGTKSLTTDSASPRKVPTITFATRQKVLLLILPPRREKWPRLHLLLGNMPTITFATREQIWEQIWEQNATGERAHTIPRTHFVE